MNMNIKFENNDVIFGNVAVARLMEYSSEDHGSHSMVTPGGELVPFQPSMAPDEGSLVWIVNRENEEFSIARTIGAISNYINRVSNT